MGDNSEVNRVGRDESDARSSSPEDSLIQHNLAVFEGAFAREPANRGVLVFNLPGSRSAFIDDLGEILEKRYKLNIQSVEDPGAPELPLAVRAFNPQIEPRASQIRDVWAQNETFQHTELMSQDVMAEVMHIPSASSSSDSSDISERSQDVTSGMHMSAVEEHSPNS
ncbi:hypothetical protein O6H91_13G060400 [Diphasiastrum complanatum]|uniref:Uncharacterized protein n=1 Tax=Diphasiastrum complanatum TaxID=34168 RepID=A0ACC2BV87_DIPCM|nr:hypothetical protein O6H91_13G060400 [Diphasiastrum complanatum]